MKQADLDRAVARATGETVSTIKRLGFLLAEPGGRSMQRGVDQVQVGSSSDRCCIRSEHLGGQIDPLIERDVDGPIASHVSASRPRISPCSEIVVVTVSANPTSTGAT